MAGADSVPDRVDDRLSRMFAALADPTRRDLVTRLATSEATLTELAASYDVSVQAVSKHLKALEDAGLVRRTRDGQRRPCHLEAEVLELMTGWIERRRREAEGRYQRLDAVLDRMTDEHGAEGPRGGAASRPPTTRPGRPQAGDAHRPPDRVHRAPAAWRAG